MHDLHVIQGPNVTRDAREKIAFFAFHAFVVEDSRFQQNRVRPGGVRTTIALHCGWMISNMAAEAWLFGDFSYTFFKSMTSYIAFYFT